MKRCVRPYREGAIPESQGQPFGQHFNAEMALIGSMLRSYGLDDGYIARQAVRTRSYDGQESYAEHQRRVLFPRWAANQPPSTAFTIEELAFLAERFAGANDPVAQSIAVKVGRLLAKKAGPEGPAS